MGNTVRVTNSFAVPFEEDEKDPAVWFLDHNYVESMRDMFKTVNAREKLIGWYHSGPKLRASDLQINELFKRYTPDPLLCIVDIEPKDIGVPTDAYFAVEEIKDDGTTTSKTFVHTPTIIEAEEAEEIGVEHLLRDIRDVSQGSLQARITQQLHSLQGLHVRLRDIGSYLAKVNRGELPVNHTILGLLQDVFNLLPNLSTPSVDDDTNELARAMSIKTNDQLMNIYVSSLIRAIIAFHDLIDNKIKNRQDQAEETEKEEARQKEREAKEKGEKSEGDKDKKEDTPERKGGIDKDSEL